MSSVSSPSKSRRSHPSLSCVSKRPDSTVLESRNTETFKVIKRPTIDVVCNSQSFPNHRGSGATLDDASSLVDQSSSVVSPVKMASSKSSLGETCASQSDLLEINYKLTTLAITQRESIYVRALFRYDPSADRGLAARVSSCVNYSVTSLSVVQYCAIVVYSWRFRFNGFLDTTSVISLDSRITNFYC